MFGFGPTATRASMPQPDLQQNPSFALKGPGFFSKAMDRAGGPGAILQALSAGARDLGNPGQNNLPRTLQMLQEQREQEEQKTRAAELWSQIQGQGGGLTRESLLGIIGPQLTEQGNYGALAGLLPDEEQSKTFSTTDGIVERKPDGTWGLAYEVKPKPEKLEGDAWTIRDPITGAVKLRPGAIDALDAISGARREAIVSRPMPRAAPRASSGGGGGGYTGLPPGYRPRAR